MIAVITAVLALFMMSERAYACGGCGCEIGAANQTRQKITTQHTKTKQRVTSEFAYQRSWFTNDFFIGNVEPALRGMANQLTAGAMQQVVSVGTMFDAQEQLAAQRLFQEKRAEAHKDYQPSTGVCTMGTLTRSLAAADRSAEFNAVVAGQRSLDRQLGTQYSSTALGKVGKVNPITKEILQTGDRESRLTAYKERYCDPNDLNGAAVPLCQQPGEFVNRDIDFTRLVERPRTLQINFADTTLTDDEKDYLALSSNLFSHDVMERLSRAEAGDISNEDEYLDLRSLVAKRSVAENSFYKSTLLKSEGTDKAEDTAQYMAVIMQQLGVDDASMEDYLGHNPSYYAQMELLSQRLYQQPEFYIDLYDKPANVARKDVAMQAVGLMLDRNMFESELRSEAVLSVLLELELELLQQESQARFGALKNVVHRE